MTRVSRLFFAVILILSVVSAAIACEKASEIPDQTGVDSSDGTEIQSGDKTTNTTDTEGPEATAGNDAVPSVDPADYYKFVSFTLPTDFRQAAEDYMRAQSRFTWTAGETFSTQQKFESWTSANITYNKGVVYTGLPYSNRSCTSDEFLLVIGDGRVYNEKDCDLETVFGNGCASSVMLSFEQFSHIGGLSSAFDPASKSFYGKKVGDYAVEQGQTSEEVVKANGVQTMFESYALAQKGDVMFHGPAAPHVRMIVDSHVERKSDGSIIGKKSWLSVIEQTDAMEYHRADNIRSTWKVDKQYDFETLLSTNYLVTTLPEYETGVSDVPYLALNKEITASDLASKSLNGSVVSNRVVHFVFLELYSRSGELVKRVIADKFYTENKIDLRKRAVRLFEDVSPGDYTFVLTAGIASGSAELGRVGFTLK